MDVQLFVFTYFVLFRNQVAGITIRIVSPLNNGVGRLEVYYHGEWGTVCDDSFNADEATVACRQLGRYQTGFRSRAVSNFGYGSGQIWLDDLGCTGSESSLSDCSHRGWGVHNCGHGEDVGVICDERDITMKLSGYSSGLLQVYHSGSWGTVCDDDFGQIEASVVCRALGYQSGEVIDTSSSIRMWLDDVQCTMQNTDLKYCKHRNWGDNNCGDSEAVCVRCYSFPQGYTEARLVPLNYHTGEGKLEVYYKNQWGNVCSSGFGTNEAEVTCRMLGYLSYGASISSGYGRGTALLTNVKCQGTELSLNDCLHKKWGTYSCTFVGIRCGSFSARLVSPSNVLGSGRLELYYNGEWGAVCRDGLSNEEARVTCRMLGHPVTHESQVTTATSGSLPVRLNHVMCTGSEGSLNDCLYGQWSRYNCSAAGITWSYVRLVAGDGHTHGRLEVFYNSQWGTVVGDGFTNASASVVCRMLGQPHSKAYFIGGAEYGEGTGRVWLSNVSCQGYESSIRDCSHSGWGSPTNNHSRDVGVVCSYIPVVHLEPNTSHLLAILGNEIRVSCVVDDANPSVTSYKWVHNNEQKNTTNQTTFITPAVESAQGTITCTAHNGIGSGGSATAYINILHPPVLDCQEELKLELGASQTVQCEVSSKPVPISDVRGPDGEKLKSQVIFNESKLTFELSNVTGRDAGLYVVTARNLMIDYRGVTLNGSSTEVINVHVHVPEHTESSPVSMKLVAIVTGCVAAVTIILLSISLGYLQKRLNTKAKKGIKEEQQTPNRSATGISKVVYLRDSDGVGIKEEQQTPNRSATGISNVVYLRDSDGVGPDEVHIYEQLHQDQNVKRRYSEADRKSCPVL